jgi:hypothetical protein
MQPMQGLGELRLDVTLLCWLSVCFMCVQWRFCPLECRQYQARMHLTYT